MPNSLYTHSIPLVTSADSTTPAYKNQYILCDYAIHQHQLRINFNLAHLFAVDNNIIWDNHPKNHNAARTDYLWESTCLEVFLQPKLAGCTAYVEINIAPNNNWNAYFFEDYRQPQCMPPRYAHISQPTVITTSNYSGNPLACFQRTLHIDLAQIYACIHTNNHSQQLANMTYSSNTAWLANFTAVVKSGQTTDYFAKQHPTPADFHLRDNWFELFGGVHE